MWICSTYCLHLLHLSGEFVFPLIDRDNERNVSKKAEQWRKHGLILVDLIMASLGSIQSELFSDSLIISKCKKQVRKNASSWFQFTACYCFANSAFCYLCFLVVTNLWTQKEKNNRNQTHTKISLPSLPTQPAFLSYRNWFMPVYRSLSAVWPHLCYPSELSSLAPFVLPLWIVQSTE